MVDTEKLERVLLRVARDRETITYGELLAFFERRVTRITVGALCKDLGVVCRKVEGEGAPDLACLVVRKSDGLPGEGYFQSLRDEGSYDGPSEGEPARTELRRRQERAYDYVADLVARGMAGPSDGRHDDVGTTRP